MEKPEKEEVNIQVAAAPSGFHRALKMLSWPIAAATGVFYGHRHARNRIYDTLKGQGEFNDLLKERDEAVRAVKPNVMPETLGSMDYILQGEVGKANRKYEKAVSKRLEQRGYKFTHQFMGDLSHTEMFETAAIAISAASVALGVVLTIADNKKILDKFTNRGSKDNTAQLQA